MAPDIVGDSLNFLTSEEENASEAPNMLIEHMKEEKRSSGGGGGDESKSSNGGQVDAAAAAATTASEASPKNEETWLLLRKDLKWLNIFLITVFHAMGIYGFLTAPYLQCWKTFLWATFVGISAAFGITGGIHRYWSHKSYKANVPLRIILMFCFLAAGQNSIYQWVRDHRVHHKYSETDADPHNSNRGFFFSHVGWLMMKKHPEVIKKGNQIDMSDIEADPVAAFCERHFVLLKLLVCFVIPIALPVYCWNETWYYATLFQISRYIYVLNATWSVNSFAHFFGNKPYDKYIRPVENKFVSYVTLGEGWHNYHHAFPSDYRAAEFGGGRFNSTASVIDLFARLGWAYDLKEPSKSLVRTIVTKRGDGSHVSADDWKHGQDGKSS